MDAVRISVMALLTLLLGGCMHTGVPVDPLVARADCFEMRTSDLDAWEKVFEKDPSLRRKLAEAKNREEMIARQAALSSILEVEYGDEVPDIIRRQIRRELEDAEIDRSYVRQVLSPRLVIDSEEVRAIYTENRANYRRKAGVVVLEIFLWAPEDLPDLRSEKRELLEGVREEVSDPGAFRRKAGIVSDATNAYRGGSIGSISEDRVGGALHAALFTGRTGMTDIVESPEGLFLFWITRLIPPKDNTFEDVAEGIEKKLRSRQLSRLKAEDLEKLREEHEIEVRDPGDEAEEGDVVLILDGKPFSLDQLDLPVFNRGAVERRALALIRKGILEELGFRIDRPDQRIYRYRLARKILRRIVDRKMAELGPGKVEEDSGEPCKGPELERWSLDLLRIPGAEGPGQLSMVFRALHDLRPGADIEQLAALVAENGGPEGKITHYDDVLASSLAGLGPEIHTTIKKFLQPGNFSRPLYLSQRQEIVVIAFKGRRIDREASRKTAEKMCERRNRKEVEEKFIDTLLKDHGFVMLPSPWRT